MLETIGVIVLILLLLVVVVCYERELRSMTRLLDRFDRRSSERISVEFQTPGMVKVARAVNNKLDDQREERAEDAVARQTFQEDLAALSHDVRTPLAGAQGYLQLYGREADADERDRCVGEAQGRLFAMRELVDQLFEYTKAVDPARELMLERIEIFPLLAESLAALYPEFSERGWSPVVDFEDEGVTAFADRNALMRVFNNLEMNVLRHGVDAPVIRQRGRVVTFSNEITDADSLDVERMFDRFYCSDAARGVRGSGLGLSIVAHLCEAMGVSVSAECVGSTLCVTLEFLEVDSMYWVGASSDAPTSDCP